MIAHGVVVLRRALLSPEALTVLAFSVAQLALGLGSSRLLTQLASPPALGEYYLYMNLAQWLTLPATSSYPYLWKTWPMARASGRLPAFVRRIRHGLTWQSAFCIAGAAFIGLAGLVPASVQLVGTIAIVSATLAANLTLDPIQTIERRRVRAGVLALLATPFRQFALALACALFVGQSGAALLATQSAYGLFTTAVSVTFLIGVGRKVAGEAEPPTPAAPEETFSRFARFSTPFLVTGAVTQAAVSAERWGLATRADTGATAIFVQAVAVSIAATGAAALPITTYFTPLITQGAAKTPENPLLTASRPLRSYIVLTALALAACSVVISVLAGPLTAVFFGPKYRAIALLLPWTVSGQALFALSQAIALVPISVESTVGLNVALIGSKAAYIGLLVLTTVQGDYALWFSKCFLLSNLFYLLCMLGATALAVRRERARVDSVQAAAGP